MEALEIAIKSVKKLKELSDEFKYLEIQQVILDLAKSLLQSEQENFKLQQEKFKLEKRVFELEDKQDNTSSPFVSLRRG